MYVPTRRSSALNKRSHQGLRGREAVVGAAAVERLVDAHRPVAHRDVGARMRSAAALQALGDDGLLRYGKHGFLLSAFALSRLMRRVRRSRVKARAQDRSP